MLLINATTLQKLNDIRKCMQESAKINESHYTYCPSMTSDILDLLYN